MPGLPRRTRIPALLAISAGILATTATGASAVTFPAQDDIRIQTNGPDGDVAWGDWYTGSRRPGGAGYHYVEIHVPDAWPRTRAIDVDIFSAEMTDANTALTASLEESEGATVDKTEFELYGPNAEVTGPRSPGRGGAHNITRRTYNPRTGAEQWSRFETITRPHPGSTYVVRAETKGNDQNSWMLRVGDDNDANPSNLPPANFDDPDRVSGSGDELVIKPVYVAYQHWGNAGACHTFQKFVEPGSASVAFHNFDMDIGNTGVVPASQESQVRLRYYAPGGAYDATGHVAGRTPSNHAAAILSGNAVWNGGTLDSRVGDQFTNPTPGWWRIVYCANNNNQYIVESDGIGPRPAAPQVQASMSDRLTSVAPGTTLTYRVDVTNEASGATAAAAANVKVTDVLPAELTFVSCRVVNPFRGTCIVNATTGRPEARVTGLLRAGRTAQVEVKAQVAATTPSGTVIENRGLVDYTDTFDQDYPQIEVSDRTTYTTSGTPSAPDPPPTGGGSGPGF